MAYRTDTDKYKLQRLLQHRRYWVWLGSMFSIILGLVYLQNMFSEESTEAKKQLSAQQEALSQFAVKSLQQILHHKIELAKSNILNIAKDPLLPDQGLLYFQQGEQLLPRRSQHPANTEQSARSLYQWTLQVEPLDLIIEKAGVWEERLNLLSDFKLAILSGANDEVRWSFRALREHRAANTISAEKDIPFMLAVIDYLINHSNPSPQLISGLLRDGSIVEQERGVFGLQRQLLLNRNKFTQDDFDFLSEKLSEICDRYQVPVKDFLEQAKKPAQKVFINDLSNWQAGINGHWYIEPVASEELIGIPVSFEDLTQQVRSEMTLLGLLGKTDEIKINAEQKQFKSLTSIDIKISSPYWEEKFDQIERRYHVKTASLMAFAILTIAVFVISIIRALQEQELLDLKSDFIATVSHELRTPITALRLMADGLLKYGSDSSKTKNYPKRISNTLQELGLLVENILSFNRIKKNLLQANCHVISLGELINDVLFELQQHSDIDIQYQVNLADLEINADEELMRILFRNLINNSIKYNRHELVKLRIYALDSACIVYSDNGYGIEKDQWENVFAEFTRLKQQNESKPGTGLGLSLCRRIMQLHNGKIFISRSDAGGSDFTICFSTSTNTDLAHV